MTDSQARFSAKIPLDQDRELRVTLNTSGGREVADLRMFRRSSPARVMMTTGRSIQVDLTAALALADALMAAHAGRHGAEAPRLIASGA